MRVIIHPERILWVLVGVAAVLGFMHLATRYIMLQGIESPTMRKLLDLFNMNLEVSIPTWYSQMLLIFAALVAGFIGLVRRAQGEKYAIHWLAIACILGFMSLDEGSQIHEIANDPLQRALDTQYTWLHYAWVLAAGAVVLIVVLLFLRFWWKQPASTRILLALAAAVFLIGAVGFEVLGGFVQQNVSTGMKRAVVNMLEETFEMLGSTLAIYAFLTFLRRVSPDNSLVLVKSRRAANRQSS